MPRLHADFNSQGEQGRVWRIKREDLGCPDYSTLRYLDSGEPQFQR